MLMQERFKSSTDYRFGFQGQELDNEIKGKGNSINYKYRMHSPRVGRFFAVDPLSPKYPALTPYQFSSNNPIAMVEIEGLEGEWKVDIQTAMKQMEVALDNGASHEQALKVYRQTLDYLRPFRRMPDETVYVIAAFAGGVVVMAIGVKAAAVWLLEEGAEYLVEEATGFPIIIDPIDAAEYITKHGVKRTAKKFCLQIIL